MEQSEVIALSSFLVLRGGGFLPHSTNPWQAVKSSAQDDACIAQAGADFLGVGSVARLHHHAEIGRFHRRVCHHAVVTDFQDIAARPSEQPFRYSIVTPPMPSRGGETCPIRTATT